MPRGYPDTLATGPHLATYTTAYRFPVWRPFDALGTSPFVTRQLVMELYYEAGKISSNRAFGDGEWFRSVGAEVTINLEFWGFLLNPGLGVSQQLDGEEDAELNFVLRGIF